MKPRRGWEGEGEQIGLEEGGNGKVQRVGKSINHAKDRHVPPGRGDDYPHTANWGGEKREGLY